MLREGELISLYTYDKTDIRASIQSACLVREILELNLAQHSNNNTVRRKPDENISKNEMKRWSRIIKRYN